MVLDPFGGLGMANLGFSLPRQRPGAAACLRANNHMHGGFPGLASRSMIIPGPGRVWGLGFRVLGCVPGPSKVCGLEAC